MKSMGSNVKCQFSSFVHAFRKLCTSSTRINFIEFVRISNGNKYRDKGMSNPIYCNVNFTCSM